jgi:tetratricopeptide (TPR) repeat protein
MSFVGLYLMFYYTHGVRNVEESRVEQEATTTEPVVDTSASAPVLLPPDMPKYGGVEKTPEQRSADTAYVEGMLAKYGTLEDALNAELAIGWEAFFARASTTAIHSFNRAWLLSSTSSDALYGMGLVEGVRGHFDASIALINEALVLDDTRPYMHCDSALSYYNLSLLTPSDATSTLQTARAEIQIVEDAGAMNTACYRTAGRIARAQGEEAEALEYEQQASSSTRVKAEDE